MSEEKDDIGKEVKIRDFDSELEKFAFEIITAARGLKGKQHFSERLDAFKAATAYKAMMNKAADDPEPGGGGIVELQRELLDEPEDHPTPEETPPPEGTDDSEE